MNWPRMHMSDKSFAIFVAKSVRCVYIALIMAKTTDDSDINLCSWLFTISAKTDSRTSPSKSTQTFNKQKPILDLYSLLAIESLKN